MLLSQAPSTLFAVSLDVLVPFSWSSPFRSCGQKAGVLVNPPSLPFHKYACLQDEAEIQWSERKGREGSPHLLGATVPLKVLSVHLFHSFDSYGFLLCVCMLSHVQLLQPHRLQPASLLCPWKSPGKNTGVGSHSLLQGIFPTQGSNIALLHYRRILY